MSLNFLMAQIMTEGFENGVYFIRISTENHIVTKKIFIQ